MSTQTKLVSVILAMVSVVALPLVASAQTPRGRDVVSITAGFIGGHYEGGQSASSVHGFVGLDLDARYYVGGQHGIALRGFTGGSLWGGGSAHALEARYSYRLATDPMRAFGASLALDIGAGAGALEAHETVGFGVLYQEHYVPVYGVAAVRGDLHIAAFDLGLELGLRAGATPMTSHEGQAGARILGSAFVSPYFGVRVGSTFSL